MSEHDEADGHPTKPERDALSRVLGALADPTRRAMLERLTAGPASVTELAAPMPMSLAAVSKHLGVLEDAGLVTRGRAAQYRPARLETEPFVDVVDWIAGVLSVGSREDAPAGAIMTVRRELPHPPALVWSAWTQPDRFAAWFGTEAVDVPVASVQLDARAGGALRATMRLPHGTEQQWEGAFVEVVEPARLVFTLTDEPGTDAGDPIVVEMSPLEGGGTVLSLRQSTEGFDVDGVAALEAGYGAFFDAMHRVLDTVAD